MAFHHVVLFCTIMSLWYMFANAQGSVDKKNSYLVPEKTRQLFLPSLRSRKISQRAFQDLDLLTARSYGKRGSDCFGGLCGKRIPEFAGARLYGKRNIDMNQLKCLFIDCGEMENENNVRNMDFVRSRFNKFRRDQEIVLPD